MLTGEVAAEEDQGGSWPAGMLMSAAGEAAEARDELLLTEDELLELEAALEPRPLDVTEATPGLLLSWKEFLSTAALASCFWYSGSAADTARHSQVFVKMG